VLFQLCRVRGLTPTAAAAAVLRGFGGGRRACGRGGSGSGQRRRVRKRRADIDDAKPIPLALDAPVGELPLQRLEDRLGVAPTRERLGERQHQRDR
jgi:hypothetical protein